MQTDQLASLKVLVQKFKFGPMFKRSCGFDYLDETPSVATLSRSITQLSLTKLFERIYRSMIYKANSLGLIDGNNVAIDASKITVSTPLSYIIILAYIVDINMAEPLIQKQDKLSTRPEYLIMKYPQVLKCCLEVIK